MNEYSLTEIPVTHIPLDKIGDRDPTLYEQDKYNIHYIYASFMGDFPRMARRVVKCLEYNNETIILKMDDDSFYLYELGIRDARQIAFFDDMSELTDDQWNECFGYQLRNRMFKKGMYQYELAEESGISKTIVSQYINGQTTPKFNIVEKMAKVLDCSAEDFLPRDFYFVRKQQLTKRGNR